MSVIKTKLIADDSNVTSRQDVGGEGVGGVSFADFAATAKQ